MRIVEFSRFGAGTRGAMGGARRFQKMLGDLESKGLVVRGPRSKAGRSVEISEKGRQAMSTSWMAYMEVDDTIGEAFGGAWFDGSCERLLIWERVCRRVRHACGDTLFQKAFGWIQEPDD